MATAKKKTKKAEKSYSYEEFLKTFYPKQVSELNSMPPDPRIFGGKLAEAALRKIARERENK
jgi:hypothetical protein